jgi:peptidoglycan/xylan/chitin deacetylase (PgdA/CDA1 family)
MTLALICGALLASSFFGISTGPSAEALPLKPQKWREIQPEKVRFIAPIETTDKVFFITIDDGWTKDPAVARWVRQTRTPITVFLTSVANPEDTTDFFRTVSRYGSVQNHTRTHKYLTSSNTDINSEVCSIQSTYAKRYGGRPWMLRPPYGNGGWPNSSTYEHQRISSVVGPCGIKYVVNWSALVSNEGKFESQNGTDRIAAGDIVLLHFVPGLRNQLAALVERGKLSGLKPANLADYLQRPAPPLKRVTDPRVR